MNTKLGTVLKGQRVEIWTVSTSDFFECPSFAGTSFIQDAGRVCVVPRMTILATVDGKIRINLLPKEMMKVLASSSTAESCTVNAAAGGSNPSSPATIESETLKAIMRHWTALDEKGEPEGMITLPFNIEAFCRENDEKLRPPEPSPKPVKAIQLVDGGNGKLIALCDDGTIWMRVSKEWIALPEPVSPDWTLLRHPPKVNDEKLRPESFPKPWTPEHPPKKDPWRSDFEELKKAWVERYASEHLIDWTPEVRIPPPKVNK